MSPPSREEPPSAPSALSSVTEHERSSGSDDGTFVDTQQRSPPQNINLDRLRTDDLEGDYRSQYQSPSRAREASRRLEDDIEMLKAERVVSKASQQSRAPGNSILSPVGEPVDEFDVAVNPVHETERGIWRPPKEPATKIAKILKRIHQSSIFVRYFTYIVPVVLVLLIPLLLGALLFKKATVGKVYLTWFMVWLEIVWLSLWAGRIISKLLPYPIGFIASAITNGSKKWRDMAKMLEVPATIFFWWLGIYVSFKPTMTNHHSFPSHETQYWEKNANIVLLSIFVGAVLNFVEKIIIQLIAISFHQRTYADRIELNKFQIGSLSKLYQFAKKSEEQWKNDEGNENSEVHSGAVTPKVVLQQARAGAQAALNTIGDAFGKVAGDFTGKQISSSTSPQQVVLTLLQTNDGSQVLARRLYRTFVRDEADNVQSEDLKDAFTNEEEAEAAFTMFDRDLNGDISCEEMELACVEVGRERKAITASLKDLDSVVGKLDDVLTFIVIVIALLVFLSLISKSTAGVLTSASSSVLALSWLFSATAQEFLASLIFVFIKHPFDVGDRVDIYNTGGTAVVDTYYVKEIALMYTEFKKTTGQVVQAPNSLLNTLFILNMRRSPAICEALPIVVKFGTSLEQIEDLRERMLEFVKSEKREYQSKIITELRDIPNMHAVNLNVIFFYKSNWQNELVRLQRRNKFMCALMVNIAELGIESPNMRWPGQKVTAPVYLQSVQADQLEQSVLDRDAPPNTHHSEYKAFEPTNTAPPHGIYRQNSEATGRSTSSVRSTSRKIDFSLGVKDIVSSDETGDVYGMEERRPRIPAARLNRVMEEEEREARRSISTNHSGSSRVEHLTSRLSGRRRAGSTSTGTVSHQNRFFGRRSHDEEMGPVSPSVASGRSFAVPVRSATMHGGDNVELRPM